MEINENQLKGAVVVNIGDKGQEPRISFITPEIGKCVNCKQKRDLRYGYCQDCAPANVHEQVETDQIGIPVSHPDVKEQVSTMDLDGIKVGRTTIGQIVRDMTDT